MQSIVYYTRLHFNVKKNQYLPISSSIKDISINNDQLNPIDILTVDKFSRLTLTKKFKKILPLHPEDKILVYQDIFNKNIVLKIQQEEKVVDNWIVIKSKDNSNMSTVGNYDSNSSSINECINGNDNLANNYKEADNSFKTFREIYKYNLGITENTHYNTSILLIDDEQDLLMTFELFLKSEGYKNVKTFSDSKNLIKHLLELGSLSRYKLAIIDIRMPHINGIQLYQILKILNLDIKIIFITALDAVNELTSMFSEIKSIDIIRKPIHQNQFVKIINDKVSTLGISLLLFISILESIQDTLSLSLSLSLSL